MPNQPLTCSNRGFTLIETLIVIVIIGILTAIIAPGWLSFLARQQLNTAQNQVYRAMREAQSEAKRTKTPWEASFREQNGIVQWAVHSADAEPIPGQWESFDRNIQIDALNTTLPSLRTASPRRVQFDYKGRVVLNPNNKLYLSRLTLNSQNGGQLKRCVFVSTILGTLRNAQDKNCKV